MFAFKTIFTCESANNKIYSIWTDSTVTVTPRSDRTVLFLPRQSKFVMLSTALN